MEKKFFLITLLMILGLNINVYSQLDIITPNGGEKWISGTETLFKWDSASGNGTYSLEFSQNNGMIWDTIATDIVDTEYKWTVPKIKSDKCLFKVSHESESIFDPYTFNISYGSISDIELSPTGELAACATGVGIVIWNVLTNDTIIVIKTHLNSIGCISWSPDGTKIVSGSFQNSLRNENLIQVWDVKSGEILDTLYESKFRDRVYCISWSPDGTKIAAGVGNKVQIFNTEDYELLRTLDIIGDYIKNVDWSPDSKSISIAARNWGSSDDATNNLTSWNVENGDNILTLTISSCYDISYSPDGSKLAVTGYKTSIYNAESGELIENLLTYRSNVSTISWSPNGDYIACIGARKAIGSNSINETLNIYDFENRKIIFSDSLAELMKPSWSFDSKSILYYFNESINYTMIENSTNVSSFLIKKSVLHSTYWSSDGKSISPNGLVFYDHNTGETTKDFDAEIGILSPDGNKVLYIKRNEDIDYIVYDKLTKKSTTFYTFKEGTMQYCLLWNSDGKRFYTATPNKKVLIWDVSDYTIIDSLEGGWRQQLEKLIISPDGKYLAGIDDLTTIFIWNLEKREKVLEYDAAAFAWHPSKPYYIKSGYKQSAEIINIETGEVVKNFTDFNSDATAVDWSPDGKLIALACYDGTIRLMETSNYTLIDSCTVNNARLKDIKFSPDSKELLTGDVLSTLNIWKLYRSNNSYDISDSVFSIIEPEIENISIDITRQTSDEIYYEYQISKETDVEISVYDLLGRKVETLIEKNNHNKGIYSGTLSTINYASSAYFLVLKTSDDLKVFKFIKLR